MKKHEKYMKKCLKLAKKGEGRVSPNPLVGAVLANQNGEIIAEGYHEVYGGPHAEINAINKADLNTAGATLYINLEPCCHYGKTPPCVDRIIESGVTRVIIGMEDPNPAVAGKGARKLQDAGIEVISGILEEDCLKLNEIFIKNMTEKNPFIAIKTASTLDGKIATSKGKSKWITSDKAREQVHRLRNKYDSIITGSGTIIADNPSLTCRLENGRNPVRIVVDSNLITPETNKVYNNDGTKVIIATSEGISLDKKTRYPAHVRIIECPLINQKIDLKFLTQKLYTDGIYSIMVEAGGKLNGAIVSQGLADKIYFFIAPKIFGDKEALSCFEGFNIENLDQCINLDFQEVKHFPPDLMIEGYLNQ